MRDRADNCVVICSIENFDPMGVHTGDSITVAPAQTLSDDEYQRMRDAAFACIRRIGVETGGSNIQFAVDPGSGDQVVIEMNPRVSRSSALASKATGFPIAKIAARLAVGYTLDEILNDITGKTPACFEPTIDYVVTKVPRWAFEKFPGIPDVLGTRMQSVGRGHGHRPHLHRVAAEGPALAGAGPPRAQLRPGREASTTRWDDDELVRRAAIATPDRPFHLEAALRRGIPSSGSTRRPAWTPGSSTRSPSSWTSGPGWPASPARGRWTAAGLAAGQAARLLRRPAGLAVVASSESRRCGQPAWPPGCGATMKTVDTCAAEFEAHTPYHYSTYEDDDEVAPSERPKIIILGSGPNRIGQGVEFDYCCVQASFALHDAGFETVMINCNPETVSTDYDTSDRLYFEPVTWEDVSNVIDVESATGTVAGVIVSLGGQTPLKLAGLLPAGSGARAPRRIRSTWPRTGSGGTPCAPGWRSPSRPAARPSTFEEARAIVERVGYPALVRPSYVLGGRAMEIVYDDEDLRRAMDELAGFGSLGREGGLSAERPGAGRPLPRGRHRGRRRRRPRRDRRGRDRRGDGARRGGRRPLRRQRLRHPAADARSGHDRGSSRATPAPSPPPSR